MDGRPAIGFFLGLAAILAGGIVARVLTSSTDWAGETPAAWAQAIGSLIGLGTAIWVPLHVRDRDSRDQVERAIKNLITAGNMVYALAEGLQLIKSQGKWTPGIQHLWAGQVAAARGLLAETPNSTLGSKAFAASLKMQMTVAVLERVMARFAESPEALTQIQAPFDEIKTDATEQISLVIRLVPVRFGRLWHAEPVPPH
jgi:hypothetical protein